MLWSQACNRLGTQAVTVYMHVISIRILCFITWWSWKLCSRYASGSAKNDMSNPVSSKTCKASLRHMNNKLMYSCNTKTFQKHLWCFGLLNHSKSVESALDLKDVQCICWPLTSLTAQSNALSSLLTFPLGKPQLVRDMNGCTKTH